MDYMKFVNYHREMNGKAAHGSCSGYPPVVCSYSYNNTHELLLLSRCVVVV